MNRTSPTLRRHAVLLAVATLVACGGAATGAGGTPTPRATARPTPTGSPSGTPVALPADRLWLLHNGQDATVQVVDLATAHTVSTLPAGVVAPDWSRLYHVAVDNAATSLQALDPRTGMLLDRVGVEAGLDLAEAAGLGGRAGGLSPGGRRLVLAGGPLDHSGHLTTSVFRVFDTAALHAAPVGLSLPGDWRVDAVDDAGRSLYLVHYAFNTADDTTTSVELWRYDLVRAGLDSNPVPRAGCPDLRTAGVALTSVATGAGAWQLSTYAFGDSGPFVEALDLADDRTTCVALPPGPTPAANPGELSLLWTMAAGPDGRTVYAVDAGLGEVAAIAATPPFTVRSAGFAPPSPSASPASWWPFGATAAEAKRALLGGAVVSPDGHTLYAAADNGIAVIDTAGLELRRSLLADQPVESMVLTPDGARLYAVSATQAGGLYVVDTAGGASTPAPGYNEVSAVLRVVPAAG